jgi:hypothetical protein
LSSRDGASGFIAKIEGKVFSFAKFNKIKPKYYKSNGTK